MLEEFIEVVDAAKIYLGVPLGDWSEETVRRVVDLLKRQKPYLAGYFGASQCVEELVSGTLCVAQAWNGDILYAMEEEPAARYMLPEEGVKAWVDFMVIPIGAEEVELAHAWANFHAGARDLRDELPVRVLRVPLRREVVSRYLPADVLGNEAIHPPPGTRLLFSEPLTEEELAILGEITLEVKGG